ncbi:MAG: thioredoxin domain-containing protein [Bacteriovoracaceae bacterium]|jgi:protein-disulfide isomerase|nr:thioredoxin domain-containing protein [Bacteriovoracaceae bacterium]
MKSQIALSILAILALALVGCNSEQQIKDTIKKNPDLLIEAIKAKPVEFIDALNDAVKIAQKGEAKRREDSEKKRLEEAFEKPLTPVLRSDETYRGGGKDSPLVLVEYSDFECPFCSRGFKTVQKLLETYPGKLTFVYKHLPLSFHANAMKASQYYEAIRLQDPKKAFKFHDEIYENQRGLKKGEGFLKGIAKKVGADMGKLAADVNSEKVKKRIAEDMQEAEKFGFSGTPGFLLNGVPVKGAYPFSHFQEIIGKLKAKGKVSL